MVREPTQPPFDPSGRTTRVPDRVERVMVGTSHLGGGGRQTGDRLARLSQS